MEKAETGTARGYRVGIMREKGGGAISYVIVQVATSTVYLARLAVEGADGATYISAEQPLTERPVWPFVASLQ